jgi:hypothetical protein
MVVSGSNLEPEAMATTLRRWGMLALSSEIVNDHELAPLIWVRRGLAAIAGGRAASAAVPGRSG